VIQKQKLISNPIHMEINETIYKKDTKGKTRFLIVNTYEVRFFEYSNTGVPRFPITIAERIDK
jgi:hypothetical protein